MSHTHPYTMHSQGFKHTKLMAEQVGCCYTVQNINLPAVNKQSDSQGGIA